MKLQHVNKNILKISRSKILILILAMIVSQIMEKVQIKLNLTESKKWGAQKAQTFRSLINDFMKPVDHFGNKIFFKK